MDMGKIDEGRIGGHGSWLGVDDILHLGWVGEGMEGDGCTSSSCGYRINDMVLNR